MSLRRWHLFALTLQGFESWKRQQENGRWGDPSTEGGPMIPKQDVSGRPAHDSLTCIKKKKKKKISSLIFHFQKLSHIFCIRYSRNSSSHTVIKYV